DDRTLAERLLVAGLNVVGSKRGVDKHGEKNFRDIALWIGTNVVVCSEVKRRLKLGAWGIDMLLTLPRFMLSDGVLTLTANVNDYMDEVIIRTMMGNPSLSPLPEPPEPWRQLNKGALGPRHWAHEGVRLVNRGKEIEEIIKRSISLGQMNQVLYALNLLQAVP